MVEQIGNPKVCANIIQVPITSKLVLRTHFVFPRFFTDVIYIRVVENGDQAKKEDENSNHRRWE